MEDEVTECVGITGWRMRLLSGWVLLGGGYGYLVGGFS